MLQEKLEEVSGILAFLDADSELLEKVSGTLAFLDADSELLRACPLAIGHGAKSREGRKPGVH